ncbi:tRNA lysidine(34) synthetase TilS [Bradyrhizobium sp.]|uniref:tRNA lysidine(34) synthetase TilS n=1 Tax=Bradyrhizobium sp. TaxID=376 RepID=UPI0025C32B5C|nr:tRNA lysidine(34) synthetase TilS [Bradyrhizobium sp.]MCA3256105.1 tRNA lysidine(34) synthetase TilS [Alphaproteobacteria bacterium]MCA3568747.1 tRNA lysidine(34) synthetase TilS [Bradyrhizobium sp.]
MRLTADAVDLARRVAALPGRPAGDNGPVALAVSGGADSLALLLLAHRDLGARTRALTVDHGLRPESAAEAAQVAAVCAALRVPHVTLVWEGPKPDANRQAAARAARYRLMGDWCAANGVGVLITAHHADDQAETLLMRLARGSGGPGLAGIREVNKVNSEVTLFRPLLGVSRKSLKMLVESAGLTPIDDPSNADPAYDRTHARALLAATPSLDPVRLAASAAHLQAGESALDWAVDLAWRSRTRRDGAALVADVADLPAEIVRRLVVRALGEFGAADPDGPAVMRLIERVSAGDAATLGGVRVAGGRLWRFAPAPPPRPVRSR